MLRNERLWFWGVETIYKKIYDILFLKKKLKKARLRFSQAFAAVTEARARIRSQVNAIKTFIDLLLYRALDNNNSIRSRWVLWKLVLS